MLSQDGEDREYPRSSNADSGLRSCLPQMPPEWMIKQTSGEGEKRMNLKDGRWIYVGERPDPYMIGGKRHGEAETRSRSVHRSLICIDRSDPFRM